jgi:hypothetical protein
MSTLLNRKHYKCLRFYWQGGGLLRRLHRKSFDLKLIRLLLGHTTLTATKRLIDSDPAFLDLRVDRRRLQRGVPQQLLHDGEPRGVWVICLLPYND